MTKARDIADFKFENIVDTGTEGTRVATGTTAQRGTTAGQLRFNTDIGLAEYYDGASYKAIDAPPEINSISPSSIDESDLGSSQTIVVTGSNFSTTVIVRIIGNDATEYTPASTTRNSSTQITITTPTNLTASNEPYGIKVINASGLSKEQLGLLSINDKPVFSVASGSLGSLPDNNRSASGLTPVTATDEESDTITFSHTAGTLPTGITFNSDGTWSGTANAESSNQTYNFTITATSGGQTATRNYSITVTAPIVVEYLVIAGGGGGGNGGGGAGGYRNSYASETSGANSSTESTITLVSGTTYTITVGGGGTSYTNAGDSNSTNGADSLISGSGLTTITSLGGGGGGTNNPTDSKIGGSGGGGHGGYTNNGQSGASGTANQGSSGGSGTTFSNVASAGGGGGAGGIGDNGNSGQAGDGGSGLSSSITGSSVSRAGGGGGGGYNNTRGNASAGGGNGADTGGNSSSNGTENTGGGGGGAYAPAGNGGSGVVILRLLAGVYSGTTTGSPTISDDGSYKVLTFTGSGSYTA